MWTPHRRSASAPPATLPRRGATMPESVSFAAFAVLGLLAVGCSIMMLATPNVVHAAFWLLGVMLALAGLFLALSAEFLALVQVMVYAGAVAVLLLFVVMLTLRRREDAVRPIDFSWPSVGLAAAFLVSVLVALRAFAPAVPRLPASAPGVAEFGRLLFTEWVLPFELASLVLLVALVGAVWWSGGGDR
ncbi:MAG: proton-conducting membrane transporter [Coriobacteriaceae bacterium]|nr:proton-conducting membrane transporter [Coriobacteriaceae bacterium]